MRLTVPALALVVLASLPAQAAPRSPHFDPETMMRTSELRRGMTGYGLSVFSGTEVTRFDVEVLGVLSQARYGEDLVLIRITSGPIVERESGIIGGMSGSPVYVDGRLIGAIAYGWSYLKEPIGACSPIEAMLEAREPGGEPAQEPGDQAALPDDQPARGARLAGRWIDRARVEADGSRPFVDERTISLRPVNPLISAAGMGEAATSRLEELFGPHGFDVMAGPGRLGEDIDVQLQPGSALGVQLMEGDLDISTVGTLTWRDGDDILAFGHPMMKAGLVEIPITSAWIHDFLPSVARSNKLSSPIRRVGAMTTDVAWSVGGRLGQDAPMIPARIVVTDEDRGITREWEVSVARHELLTRELMISAMFGAMEATYNPGSDGIGSLQFEVRGDEGALFTRDDIVYHPGSVVPMVMWVDEAMYFINENRFEPQQVQSLTARVSLSGEERLASVERVYTEEDVARAGRQLTVHVVLRPEGGEQFERVVTFDLPENLPKGSLRVGAAAGEDEYSLRALLRLIMPQIDSVPDIAELIRTMKRANQLYVAVGLPQITLGLEGTRLPALPAEVVELMAEDERSDLTAGYTELSETLDTEYYLMGLQMARLPTENRLGERGKVSRKPDAEGNGSQAALATDGMPHMWWATSALKSDARPASARPTDDRDLPPGLQPEPEPDLPADVEAEEPEEIEEAEEEEDEEHPEPDGEALTRGLSSFSHDAADDFEDGQPEGTMVRSDGTVLLAPAAEMVGRARETMAWALAADGADCWLGVSNPGRVYRWRPGGDLEAVLDTGSLMVLSLLPLGDGSVLAGTGPDGRVLQITAGGEVARTWELPARYVWSLETGDDGTPVAGTGPDGRIFRLAQQPERLTQVSRPHVLDLLRDGERLYAACGDDGGAVFEIRGAYAHEIFGADEQSCTALALDGLGRLVVATADSGKVYVLDAEGHATEVLESDGHVLGLASAAGRVWATSTDGGAILAIDTADEHAVAHEDEVTQQMVRVAPGDDVVFAVTASPVRLWRLDVTANAEGTYTSAGLDAERLSRWARIDWDARVPDGAQLSLELRSGNSQYPDDGSWSAWTQPVTEPGQRIAAAPARYLQYRVRLSGSPGDSPRLRRLEALYLPRNRPPTIEIDRPQPGDALRDEYELSWEAEDEDEDTLLVTVSIRAAGEEAWTELGQIEDEDSWTWHTTDTDDGTYSLRLEVTDGPSNPTDAATERALIDRIVVDNGCPVINVLARPRRGDEVPELLGLATDALSRLTSIDWTLGGEERWRAAPVRDGMLDSRRELFTVRLPNVPEEETQMKLRVRDAAGNVTVETIPLLDQQPESEMQAQPLSDEDEGGDEQ